jgi:hypothetical protein
MTDLSSRVHMTASLCADTMWLETLGSIQVQQLPERRVTMMTHYIDGTPCKYPETHGDATLLVRVWVAKTCMLVHVCVRLANSYG